MVDLIPIGRDRERERESLSFEACFFFFSSFFLYTVTSLPERNASQILIVEMIETNCIDKLSYRMNFILYIYCL